MNGQLHALVALLQRKGTRYYLAKRLVGPQSRAVLVGPQSRAVLSAVHEDFCDI